MPGDDRPVSGRNPNRRGRLDAHQCRALGERIGSYLITGLLGEGGQALVYRAEQQTPRRPVALKVLKGGRLVGEQDLRHFQREIQTLAALNHPAIATVYEGGRTAEGQHFFAMELIDGLPLDTYVRERNLPLRERLELFCKVCAGVQYAHERGVIHRDLKPSNILVVEEGSVGGGTGVPPVAPGGRDARPTLPPVSGAVGQPKLLDFSLARLMNTDVPLAQTTTQTGQILGTLRYLSPRQARGDSETIVLKTLEKEPARRYQSAAEFGADLHRYPKGEPIRAHPPSGLYLLRKNLAEPCVIAGLAVAALALGLTGTAGGIWWSRQTIELQRVRELATAWRQLLAIQDRLEHGNPADFRETALAMHGQHPQLPEGCLVHTQALFRRPVPGRPGRGTGRRVGGPELPSSTGHSRGLVRLVPCDAVYWEGPPPCAGGPTP